MAVGTAADSKPRSSSVPIAGTSLPGVMPPPKAPLEKKVNLMRWANSGLLLRARDFDFAASSVYRKLEIESEIPSLWV